MFGMKLKFRKVRRQLPIKYRSPDYERIIKRNYDNCLLVEQWGIKTKEFIELSGTPISDIVMAHGICSDDVSAPKQIGNLGQGPNSIGEYLGPFHSGGLGGWPFVGSAGFGAFAGHATSTGTLFVSNMQHIGIDKYDNVGVIYRKGQTKPSSACGAIAAAINWVVANTQTAPDQNDETAPYEFAKNHQLWYLTNLLWQKNNEAPGWVDTIYKMSERMKYCTDVIELDARKYIIENMPNAVSTGDDGLGLQSSHTTKPVFFFSGKMINVDYGYDAYIHIDYFGICNKGDWIDNTVNYIRFCGL